LRFLLSQNARISSALSHCEIEYPASGSFSSRSSHCPFGPFFYITTNFQRLLESGLESIPLAGQDFAPNDPHLHRDTS
jgi:hypothetical protein